MAESEKIDLVKAIKGPTTGLFWVKTILYGLALSAILLVGWAIYKAYFKKPSPSQNITVGQGGNVNITNSLKRGLILFAEPYIGVDTKNKGSIGIRAGCRWEF